MDSTKLSFAVDASQIDIKPLLKKEFLELSMRAISSANPNRNNSWFTKESMEKGIQTFKNKPILGYFENGDFVSHNGEWTSDPETNMDYWNTLGQKGERILGVIRSEDDVKIVEDKDGVSWICLTCALWTQYSYKQVKRLIKDAKRAKETGGTTKNISVEVDITDYEYLPNGVMKINDFNLVGITILGSRNGVKVEPGIENAELSVIDVMGNEFFEKQQNALRVAYEKLDNSKQDNEKEGESQMTIEEKEVSQFDENTEVCPECGEYPCVCEHKEHEEEQPVEEKCEEEGQENKENCEEEIQEQPVEEKCEENNEDPAEDSEVDEDDEDDDDDSDDEHEEEECGENHHMEETPVEEQSIEEQHFEEESTQEEPQEVIHEEESFDQDHVQCDMVWLLRVLTDNNFTFDDCRDYYKNYYEGKYKDFIIELIDNLYKTNQENIVTISEFMQKVVKDTLSEEDQKFANELSQFSIRELYNNYKELEKKCSELESTIASYEKQKFMDEAIAMIDSVILPDDVRDTILNMCESGEISDLETLKTKVAVASFDFDTASSTTSNEVSFSAAVVTPNVTYKKENTKEKVDKWEAIKNYTKK